MAFYIESLQKPLTTMFPVTETQSSTRPQCLLNVLRRERILKADSRCFGEILQKNFKFACSQQLCEHLPLFIKSFIVHIIYLRESRRRKSKKCRRMRRPKADFENTLPAANPTVSLIQKCIPSFNFFLFSFLDPDCF